MSSEPKYQVFEIFVPDFGQLTDEELTAKLVFFDGPWHPQTKAAVKRFKARGLELNTNWANEAYLWSCPICKRQKAEIFRVTKAGNLKATLEIHHDHLGDYFKSELSRLHGREWSSVLTDEDRHVEHLASSLIARFHHTLVCSDCNEVDGRIKKELPSIDSFFSFSPSETARIVTPKPNTTHQVNIEAAGAIWASTRPDFEGRKALAGTIMERMAAGGLKKEGAFGLSGRRNGLDASLLLLKITSGEAADFMGETLERLRRRSVSRPEVPVNKKPARSKVVSVPSDDEIARIAAGGIASRKWKASPDDWRCPVCDRSKREIVRKSKTGEWLAAIYTHVECCMRPGFDDEDLKVEDMVDHHHSFHICADCHNVMPELRRKTVDGEVHGSFLYADQLRQLFTPVPHRAHEVDWPKAALLAAGNCKWKSAIEEYWPLFRHAVYTKQSLDRLQAIVSTPNAKTIEALAARLRSDYPSDYSMDEIIEDLHHELDQAEKWQSYSSSSYVGS